MHAYILTCMKLRIRVYMHPCIYICIYKCTHIHAYIYRYSHIFTYARIYIYALAFHISARTSATTTMLDVVLVQDRCSDSEKLKIHIHACIPHMGTTSQPSPSRSTCFLCKTGTVTASNSYTYMHSACKCMKPQPPPSRSVVQDRRSDSK